MKIEITEAKSLKEFKTWSKKNTLESQTSDLIVVYIQSTITESECSEIIPTALG